MRDTYRRLNISLPESTVAMLETVADKGSRSTFIDEAIRTHVTALKKESLREAIKEGSIANADRDLEMANDWYHLEEELSQA